MKYKYTIIIPHKNSPHLLSRCLDSIPQREDLHIIVVDDNSDSSKVDFYRFPGTERRDVTVIYDKEAKGAGHARNRGLELLDSKWVLFADCDDFFTENLNAIFDEYLDCSDEIVHFDVDSVYSDTLEPCDRSSNYKGKFYKAINQRLTDILRYKMSVPWGKLISVDLIKRHNIWFDETYVSNDAMFSLLVGHYANNIGTDSKVLYIVTSSRTSLMTQTNSKNIWTRFNVALKINEFLKQHNKKAYHTNLFAYIYYFKQTGVRDVIKACIMSFRHTPAIYIGADLLACVKYALFKE